MNYLKRIKKWLKHQFLNFTSKLMVFKAKRKGHEVGERVIIMKNCSFSSGHIIIGDNSTLQKDITIVGDVEIGNNVLIGSNSVFIARNHNIDINSNALPYGTSYKMSKITIEDNVWVGQHVKIIAGVTIGEGAVIGLGAVVTSNVKPLSIVLGNPARTVMKRNEDVYNKLKESGLYLNDFRGLKYIKGIERRKYLGKIKNLLSSNKMVRDVDLFPEDPYKVREIMYNYFIRNKGLTDGIDKGSYYIKYQVNSIDDD